MQRPEINSQFQSGPKNINADLVPPFFHAEHPGEITGVGIVITSQGNPLMPGRIKGVDINVKMIIIEDRCDIARLAVF